MDGLERYRATLKQADDLLEKTSALLEKAAALKTPVRDGQKGGAQWAPSKQ